MPWSTPFREPIKAPRGRSLRTLRDAADYCARAPIREALRPEWQQAADLLMKTEKSGGPYIDMARIAAAGRESKQLFPRLPRPFK